MLQIDCKGTPYEIGLQHGREAAVQIARGISFYAKLFKLNAKLDWAATCQHALEFAPVVERIAPAFAEEMRGIADGANVAYAGVLALNVRTEINFGLFSDGCTALAWRTGTASFLAQNWDWMEEQKNNLVAINIRQAGKPNIHMITEAGIIGKIGFNSAGVGVCLNAIRAIGVDYNRLPVHLCLRSILESASKEKAIETLEKHGCASSAHMLIADREGSIGLECTAKGFGRIEMDGLGRVFHSNHLLLEHPGVTDTVWLKDSLARIDRIRELADAIGTTQPEDGDIRGLFTDEEGYPFSICRKEVQGCRTGTLFNICMDLTKRTATVAIGRPSEIEESLILRE